MRDIGDWFPPGYDWRAECTRMTVFYGLAFVHSLFFFGRLIDEYHGLFYYNRSVEHILRPEAKMMPYEEMLGSSLMGFALLMVVALFVMLVHYLYYFQGSKSIFLAKRIPGGRFLWKTCVAGPVSFILGLALTYGLLWMLYYGIYLCVTPSVCLP